jgi:hypothetical protein
MLAIDQEGPPLIPMLCCTVGFLRWALKTRGSCFAPPPFQLSSRLYRPKNGISIETNLFTKRFVYGILLETINPLVMVPSQVRPRSSLDIFRLDGGDSPQPPYADMFLERGPHARRRSWNGRSAFALRSMPVSGLSGLYTLC